MFKSLLPAYFLGCSQGGENRKEDKETNTMGTINW